MTHFTTATTALVLGTWPIWLPGVLVALGYAGGLAVKAHGGEGR